MIHFAIKIILHSCYFLSRFLAFASLIKCSLSTALLYGVLALPLSTHESIFAPKPLKMEIHITHPNRDANELGLIYLKCTFIAK